MLSPAETEPQDKRKRLALYMRDDVRRIVDYLLKGNGDIRPRRDPHTGDYLLDQMLGVNLVKELAEVGVVDEYQITSVPACPECGHSDFYVDYACPSCKQRDLERGTMIEHYACGHTDSESRFTSGNDLTCPKCSRTLRLSGTDYRRIDRVYRCLSCKRYRLNERLRPEAVTRCALESPIINALKEFGYEVKAPSVEKGLSGIDDTFDICAKKEGSVSSPEVQPLEIVTSPPRFSNQNSSALEDSMRSLRERMATLLREANEVEELTNQTTRSRDIL
jgi:hypothetical protein